MGIISKQRTLETFKTKLALKSKNTQLVYKDAFINFTRFCNDKMNSDFESVISDLKIVDEETLYDTLQLWITYNVDGIQWDDEKKIVKKERSPRSLSTIRTWFSCVNNYLRYKGIKLDPRDVNDNLTFPKNIQEELYGLTVEDIKKILEPARFDKKIMFLCQLSSGMRLGELLQVRKSDLDLSKKRIMIKLRPSIAKGNKARTTFFSKESGSMLKNLIRNLDDDDLIFGSDDVIINNVRNSNERILISYCKKARLDKKYENSNRYKITSHSFRAFFITKLSRHDENFAKKLAGQNGYLLQYDRMNDDEKLEKYIEFENDLTIYDDNRIKTELEQVKESKDKLYAELRRMKELTYTKAEIDDLIKQAKK